MPFDVLPQAPVRVLGYTLIELIVVLVLVGILSAFVVSKAMPRAGESTAGYQAQRLASDLRHAQMLALAWGRALTFTAVSGSYSVVCVATGGPCVSTGSPVTDPGRDGPFTVNLDNVSLNSASTTFNILGKPSAAASFTLSSGGTTVATVAVAADTGFVTVTMQ